MFSLLRFPIHESPIADPVMSTDFICRLHRASIGKGEKAGGLNKTDVWLLLHFAHQMGIIDFKLREEHGWLPRQEADLAGSQEASEEAQGCTD